MIRAAKPKVLPPYKGQSLYSLGYQLRDIDEFLQALHAARIDAVVDVRLTAFSRKAGFSKGRLSDELGGLGIDYFHADFAGNPRELRRGSDSHAEVLENFEAYLEQNPSVVSELATMVRKIGNHRRVCFICYERHPDDCHRGVLVRAWRGLADRDFPVDHLAVEGAPRLIRE